MLALEQSAEKWPFSAGAGGGGRVTAGYGPALHLQLYSFIL